MNPWLPLFAASSFCVVFPGVSRADDIPRPEHPRPDFQRDTWKNLNGTWAFRFDANDQGVKDEWWQPHARGFDREITVPFCWESELSGVHDTSGQKVGWYRRTVSVPDVAGWNGKHVWLCFGAVDWRADVWVNGRKLGKNEVGFAHDGAHEGGYTPFEFDITDHAPPGSDATIVVRAFDANDPSLPTGKQVGWYTPTSGIWQTVWLEARPKLRLFDFYTKWTPDGERWRGDFWAVAGTSSGKSQLKVSSPDLTVQSTITLAMLDGSIATFRGQIVVSTPKLWSPENPHLYDLKLELTEPDAPPDVVSTYFGLRTIARGRFGDLPHEVVLLNGKPIYLRGALDQSFNPKGIYTAPSDEFLRKDIELAKSLGLDFLRIHIKSEEPRRLYWADKLGMLIMQDMPNTWRQNERARQAWERTARNTIARDRNHPSIFAWVDFNETWGLGHPNPYKSDKDTQNWVKSMVAMTRALDPTRLVEDNSPCYYDHVAVTDLNSWHFYIDDYDSARRHIEEVVARSVPGSQFNHCPGEAMNSAPLINSEYGSVSAGGGDRDVSWGFRYLTTQLRRHEKIQGYIYTELSDIEWEHNGFVNYDRSPKEFGYDAFVPGMTVADLQGADFVGFDAPPCLVTKPGEEIAIPIFVSHFSDRAGVPKLRWWLTATNDLGEAVSTEAVTRAVAWQQFRVSEQEPLTMRLPGKRPLVGAVALELIDETGRRIAANFVNVWARASSPRVEVIGPNAVALRFKPYDFGAATEFDGGLGPASLGGHEKFSGDGSGRLIYDVSLPQFVRNAGPSRLEFLAEVATRAGDRKLDWPSRRNRQDYPQTDETKHNGRLELWVDRDAVIRMQLDDDPADARGVLSHLAGWEHGSYGSLIRTTLAPVAGSRINVDHLRLINRIPLVLEVPNGAGGSSGLSVFGESLGRFPIDPTVIVHTEKPVEHAVGWTSDDRVSGGRLIDDLPRFVATGEIGGHDWRFTTEKPPDGWQSVAFDESSWNRGKSGFGTPGTPGVKIQTTWNTPQIWLRTQVERGAKDLVRVLRIFHDEDIEIYVNGQLLTSRRGFVTNYQQLLLTPEQSQLFRRGRNTIAVHCRQTGGGQGVDVGFSVTATKTDLP